MASRKQYVSLQQRIFGIQSVQELKKISTPQQIANRRIYNLKKTIQEFKNKPKQQLNIQILIDQKLKKNEHQIINQKMIVQINTKQNQSEIKINDHSEIQNTPKDLANQTQQNNFVNQQNIEIIQQKHQQIKKVKPILNFLQNKNNDISLFKNKQSNPSNQLQIVKNQKNINIFSQPFNNLKPSPTNINIFTNPISQKNQTPVFNTFNKSDPVIKQNQYIHPQGVYNNINQQKKNNQTKNINIFSKLNQQVKSPFKLNIYDASKKQTQNIKLPVMSLFNNQITQKQTKQSNINNKDKQIKLNIQNQTKQTTSLSVKPNPQNSIFGGILVNNNQTIQTKGSFAKPKQTTSLFVKPNPQKSIFGGFQSNVTLFQSNNNSNGLFASKLFNNSNNNPFSNNNQNPFNNKTNPFSNNSANPFGNPNNNKFLIGNTSNIINNTQNNEDLEQQDEQEPPSPQINPILSTGTYEYAKNDVLFKGQANHYRKNNISQVIKNISASIEVIEGKYNFILRSLETKTILYQGLLISKSKIQYLNKNLINIKLDLILSFDVEKKKICSDMIRIQFKSEQDSKKLLQVHKKLKFD